MNEKAKKKKIIVAMSGGIDSSVAAALLKKAGFDVVGVFMRFWVESGSNIKKKTNAAIRMLREEREKWQQN